MKPKLFVLPILLILMPLSTGFTQNPVSAIDALDIEIWPDYDKPSVLVLLTGMLPEGARLPASVTLPLPEDAQINAVARIDRNDGVMKDDIFFSLDPTGTLTFITPDLRFRVEYYLPYTVDKTNRSFDYTWLAAIPVNNFQINVQQPASASTLSTDPAPENVFEGGDGFVYLTFPDRAVPAGQPFSLHVDYQMTTSQLSVQRTPPQKTNKQTPGLPAETKTGSGMNWAIFAIVAGGLILIVALVWQITSRRLSPNSRKPNDSQVAKQSQAKFCRHCGEPTEEGDRFCSECGTEL